MLDVLYLHWEIWHFGGITSFWGNIYIPSHKQHVSITRTCSLSKKKSFSMILQVDELFSFPFVVFCVNCKNMSARTNRRLFPVYLFLFGRRSYMAMIMSSSFGLWDSVCVAWQIPTSRIIVKVEQCVTLFKNWIAIDHKLLIKSIIQQ